VHAQYLSEFAEAGLAPLRSKRRKLAGETDFDQQELTREIQTELLRNVVQFAMDVNFIRVQLVHDYRAPFTPISC
jgi:hypothetical protein